MSVIAETINRNTGLRSALRLEAITLVWMILEAAGSVAAGIAAGSLLLIAFGADSLIEIASAVVLYKRLKREATAPADESALEAVERKAAAASAYLLFALATYVLAQSAYGLWQRHAARTSGWGIAIAAIAAIGMPLLAKAKIRIADQIGSRALRADAMESLTCGYLSWVLLAGLAANALFHAWWLDSVAALVLIPFLVKEGVEALSGKCHCQGGR